MKISTKTMGGYYSGEPIAVYEVESEKIVFDRGWITPIVSGFLVLLFMAILPVYGLWLIVSDSLPMEHERVFGQPSSAMGLVMSWPISVVPLLILIRWVGNHKITIDYRQREIFFEQLGIRGLYRSEYFPFDCIRAVQLLKNTNSESMFAYQIVLVYRKDGSLHRCALLQSNIFDRAELLASSLSRRIGCKLLVGVDKS